ncbi:MAG: tetratricopeptide repeat protein, partial [Planctomycetes bacterium]|nr:tetratricopeptide repeat protein [Planctomycetota bacterium]
TIGHSKGFEYSISDGVFSGKRPFKKDEAKADAGCDYLQISAAISPGNSGGPLFNLRGEVVGVNTFGMVGGHAQSLNFSLPINEVKARLGETTDHSVEEAVREGGKHSVADLVRAGEAALAQGADEVALEYFTEAYEKDPKNLAVLVGHGDALHEVGMDYAARERFDAALELDPENARARLGLGWSYAGIEDWPRAVLAFRECLRRSPAALHPNVGYAQCLCALGRAKEGAARLATTTFAWSKKTSADEGRAIIRAISIYAAAGDRPKADELIKQIPADAVPECVRQGLRGLVAFLSGNPKEASDLLSKAVETGVTSLYIRCVLAESFRQQKEWDQSIAAYRACMRRGDWYYPALKGLARLYDDRKLLEEAIGLYRICVSLYPTDLEANIRLSQILREHGLAAEAIPFLESALQRAPNYRAAKIALGEAYADAGQREKACDLLTPIATGNPPDPTAIIALAAVYLEQGRAGDAMDLLAKTRTAGHLFARKLVLFGLALFKKDNFAAAAAAYEEAVALDPEEGAYRLLRGVAYLNADPTIGRAALNAYVDWALARPEEARRVNEAQRILQSLRR